MQFPTQAIKAAIGPRDADFLTIGNAWITLQITRRDVNDMDACVWECDNDQFDTLRAALEYAVKTLGEFQAGRAD